LTAARRGHDERVPTDPDFDAMYATDPDPWDVATSWYERRKLAVLLASLPRERYATAWEPGSGPGITTRALAGRVDLMVASDSSAVAVRMAEERCADLGHVEVRRSTLPDVPLAKPVELVVVAEFLYYLPERAAALDALWGAAVPGGHLAFMHWLHLPDDAHLSGARMQDEVAADARRRDARRLVHHFDADFRLDVYEAPA
jgi:trans-aconitate methyltransferase